MTGYKKAINGHGRCRTCSASRRAVREGKTPHIGMEVPHRICSGCGKELHYSTWSAFWTCEAKKTRCAKCTALSRPSVRELEMGVVRLYHEGISDDGIAKKMNRHLATVKRVLRKHRLSTTRKLDAKRLQPKIDKYLSLGENLYRRINRRRAQIKNEAKKSGTPFDLTTEILVELFQKQDGRCFYTDLKMSIALGEGNTRYQLSLDRIIPERGYTSGNVVWCTRKANTIKSDMTLDEMKEWMPSWYDRIQKFQKEVP